VNDDDTSSSRMTVTDEGLKNVATSPTDTRLPAGLSLVRAPLIVPIVVVLCMQLGVWETARMVVFSLTTVSCGRSS